jgi:four helix bundle protein
VATIHRFEDIEAWQKARALTKALYAVSANGPFYRDFGLRDQSRRAAVSIMANIAEGFERDGNKEFLQFLAVAKGSCGELRSHLHVALDQGYMTQEQFKSACQQAVEISRMISGLMNHLRQSAIRGGKYK